MKARDAIAGMRTVWDTPPGSLTALDYATFDTVLAQCDNIYTYIPKKVSAQLVADGGKAKEDYLKKVLPSRIVAMRIKAQQGFNQGAKLYNLFRRGTVVGDNGISAVYFTNTKAKLLEAIASEAENADVTDEATARVTALKEIYAVGTKANPADILIVLSAPINNHRLIGISLKASYSKIEPTVSNMGMNQTPFGTVIPIAKECEGPPTNPVAFQERGQDLGEQMRVFYGDDDIPQALAGRFSAAVQAETARGRIRNLLADILHLQENNLPYLFVASQGNMPVYGINFMKFKNIC